MQPHQPAPRRGLTLIILAGTACVVVVALAAAASGWNLGPILLLTIALVVSVAWSTVLYERENQIVARHLQIANNEWSRTQEELYRSENRFRQLIEHAADIILVFDHRFRFVEVNAQACEHLGYTRAELLELSISDVGVPGFEAEWCDPLKWSVQGRPVTREMEHRRKDGTTFPAEVRLTQLQIGGQPHTLLLSRDVSERKRVEAELKNQQNFVRDAFEENKHQGISLTSKRSGSKAAISLPSQIESK